MKNLTFKISAEAFDAQKHVNKTLKYIISNKKLQFREERVAELRKSYPNCKFPKKITL